jgi:ATP-binding cassette, subfamily B, bacterial
VLRQRLAPGTLKRIAGIARGYRSELVVFLAVTVAAAVVSVAVPVLAGRVVNTISEGGPDAQGTVVRLSLLVALLAFVTAGLALVARWYSARIGEGLIYELRSRVFDHVQRMPLAFFTRTQTGALVSRLNSDVIGAQQALTGTLAGIVSNVVALVVTATVMLTLSWQITLLSLVLLPIFIYPAQRVGRRLQAITREGYELNAEMNNTMTERFNVSGAMLVKLFGRPDSEAEAFSGRAGRVRDIGVVSAMYSRTFFVALTLVTSLATAAVYGLGGTFALAGQLNAGEVVTLALLLTQLYGPLTALSNVQVDVMSALVSFERVFEVLDLPPAIAERPDAVPVPADAATVEFDGVSFRYPAASEVSLASLESVAVLDQTPNAQVLSGLSFRIEPGQLVALVGPSGAGKTTISQLVPRMYDVQSGAVRIGGLDVRDATLESLRDTVGVVTQDAHMFHTTIRENLLYARPEATEAELRDALRGAQVADLVASLPDGLDTIVGDRGYRLSGGEKQRLAIARLLLKAPRVVVLDEATAHLDSESEVAVQRALKTALAGRTSLVIAHRLSTVREADAILVVQDGRIVERGRHAELLERNGLYAELYRTQFERQTTDEDLQVTRADVAEVAPG